MDAKLQQRVQRYGWDRAASDYEPLWEEQLAAARAPLLGGAALVRGQAVLDVACGTGLVSFEAARAVGRSGRVLGTDISGEMVRAAQQRATACQLSHVHFERMDAARLTVPPASFDVALCSLGLMYVSDPLAALRELRQAVRRGGRVGVAVWGTRERCGWAAVFPIVQAEVASEVCPLFFSLGGRACSASYVAQPILRCSPSSASPRSWSMRMPPRPARPPLLAVRWRLRGRALTQPCGPGCASVTCRRSSRGATVQDSGSPENSSSCMRRCRPEGLALTLLRRSLEMPARTCRPDAERPSLSAR